MALARIPNILLRSALAEAGWTEDELARHVNRVGAETGLTLRLDRRSITHWLAGRQPRPPIPDLVAEGLSRRFGRPVTASDVGLAGNQWTVDPVHARGHGDDWDVTAALAELGEIHAHGAKHERGVYSLAAAEQVPFWPQARRTHAAMAVLPAAAARLDRVQVDAVAWMAKEFAAADDAFGGGHSRSALALYLACDVVPRLQADAGLYTLRRQLLHSSTELVFLCGYMCFDDEQHALAQRYYRIALHLAAVNDDPAAYACTLGAMSAQARLLGHHQAAMRLAEGAVRAGCRTSAEGRTLLLGQMAAAAAATGNRAMASMALAAAESTQSEAGSRGTAASVDDRVAVLAYHQAAVMSLFGDDAGAIAALSRSLHARPAAKRRWRALTTARLAELYLREGRIEDAVATWQHFLDDYPHLHSGRADNAFQTMGAHLRTFSNIPIVRQLLTRATTTARNRDALRIATPPPTIGLVR